MTKKYYEILKINETATSSEIRRAYRKEALKWHPDSFGRGNSPAKTLEEAEKRIKEINEAYEILSDENKREKYKRGESVSVEKYGFDYGERIPVGELAIEKYLKLDNSVHAKLFSFQVDYVNNKNIAETKGEELPVLNDYHIIRAQRLLEILNSYYYPIYKKIGSWDKFKDKYVSVFQDNGLVWMTTSSTEGWEGGIRRFKNLIDFAREKNGLPKLSDIRIGLLEIKDGVVSIEEYNKSWTKENNETVREYENLRGKIYNSSEDWKKYEAVDSALREEMDKKAIEAEKGDFRAIWDNDSENKVAETKRFNESKLTKMKETISLMKVLIEKGKNYKLPEDTLIKDKKQLETELNVRGEFTKRNKTISVKIHNLIHEAKELIGDYEKLEVKIKEIDKYEGEEVYKTFQTEISDLKLKLNGINETKYREGVAKRIENKLKEFGKQENDLTADEKNGLSEIKGGTIRDLNKIGEIENKIIARVSKENFLKTLNNLIEEAKGLVNDVAKGTNDKLQSLRKGLYNFQFSSNIYCREVFQAKEVEAKNALNSLESISYPETPQEGPSLFRSEIVIPVCLVSMLVIGVVLVFRKVRRR